MTSTVANNAAERELRAIAVGRRNWTFAGSDEGRSGSKGQRLLAYGRNARRGMPRRAREAEAREQETKDRLLRFHDEIMKYLLPHRGEIGRRRGRASPRLP